MDLLFHIPLIEYNHAIKYSKDIIGTHGENICDSHFNGGLFQSLEYSGVKATFSRT